MLEVCVQGDDRDEIAFEVKSVEDVEMTNSASVEDVESDDWVETEFVEGRVEQIRFADSVD